MLDEKDFQRKADAAFEQLKKRMLTAGDAYDFDVEGESGKLEVLFEDIDGQRPAGRVGQDLRGRNRRAAAMHMFAQPGE